MSLAGVLSRRGWVVSRGVGAVQGWVVTENNHFLGTLDGKFPLNNITPVLYFLLHHAGFVKKFTHNILLFYRSQKANRNVAQILPTTKGIQTQKMLH